MIFSFCEVFLNQSPVLLEHKCFYVVLSNLGKSSMFEKTPSLIFPDLCRRASHSSPELINRSYYLCSFTDEWLFGTDSANHKVLVFKPEQWECYLEQRKKKISLESFSLIKACALHKDYWFISAVGRERPHVHRMHKLFQEAPSHATSSDKLRLHRHKPAFSRDWWPAQWSQRPRVREQVAIQGPFLASNTEFTIW